MTTKQYIEWMLDQMVVRCERIGELEMKKHFLAFADLGSNNSEEVNRIEDIIIENEKKVREIRENILRLAPLTEYTEQ
jgi:hypothetical protein